jgi:CubicO group peptidase (beta-lactamase class C family)
MRTILAATLFALTLPTGAQRPTFPAADWTHTTPAAAGWNLDRMQRVEDYLKTLPVTGVMLIQHGVVVSSGGEIDNRTQLHSCRKSFLSALIGIAVAKGQIHLDDTLAQLNIDDIPPSLTPQEKQATVRMLLEARSGIYHEAVYETKGMEAKRPDRGSHAPGTFWYYNNWDFNALGGIYEQATHQTIFAALEQQIGRPIGMQDFRAADGFYTRGAESKYPAYTMRMSARDFARFALLYLHHGNWNGTQVIPADWVAASTHPYSDTESGGYGYLWWTADSLTPTHHPDYVFPPGSFWLEGHLGQYAVVIPSLDLIVVTRVNSARTKEELHKRQVAELVKLVVAAATP